MQIREQKKRKTSNIYDEKWYGKTAGSHKPDGSNEPSRRRDAKTY